MNQSSSLINEVCFLGNYAEIAEDDCEVVAGVDLWDELPSEEGVDDIEIELPPFERSEEVIAKYMTVLLSGATHYRKEALRKEDVLAASSSHCMDKYLKKVDYGTDDEIETPVCAPCDESVVPVYCTYREAIAELNKAQIFSRNVRVESL